jgi:hypothetical protein
MEGRNSQRHPARLAALALFSLAFAAPQADARITSFVVGTTTSPAFGGQSFGSAGQYEQFDGTATGEIDPKDPLNATITDIELAPRNTRGMVEYSMDFSILKPIDTSRGNHTILYDVVNRGNKSSPSLNIGVTSTNPAGDGFLESEGYTLAWSGWEGDITTGIKINLPVAKNKNGSEITGRVRAEYILNNGPAATVDVTAQPAYSSISTSNAGATLTRRVHQNDPKETIDNSQWTFADCSATPFPGTPNPAKVCLKGGFDTNHIYELVYTAKNPTVAGIGFAATRDFVSFLRGGHDKDGKGDDHAKKGASATPPPANPWQDQCNNLVDRAEGLAPKSLKWRQLQKRQGPTLYYFQAGLAAASAISPAHRIVSRSGRISAMPMIPPTSIMIPQITKPVLKPSSGVAAVSRTLPMM